MLPFRNGRVIELYIRPEFRRRRVGRTLLGGMEARFRSHGCGAVYVEVFAPNRRLVATKSVSVLTSHRLDTSRSPRALATVSATRAGSRRSASSAALTPTQDGRAVLEDLGSSGRTMVNGSRISGPVFLVGGEGIQMGANALELVVAAAPVAGSPTVVVPTPSPTVMQPAPAAAPPPIAQPTPLPFDPPTFAQPPAIPAVPQ